MNQAGELAMSSEGRRAPRVRAFTSLYTRPCSDQETRDGESGGWVASLASRPPAPSQDTAAVSLPCHLHTRARAPAQANASYNLAVCAIARATDGVCRCPNDGSLVRMLKAVVAKPYGLGIEAQMYSVCMLRALYFQSNPASPDLRPLHHHSNYIICI